MLGSFLMSKPVNGSLTAMNNRNSTLAIGVRDAFDSSGRVYQEYQRSPHGGRESAIEEATTSIVWAGGIPAGYWAADFIMSRISKRLALPKMNLTLVDTKDAQTLTQATIDKYFHPALAASPKQADAAKATLQEMVKAANGKAVNTLLKHNRYYQFGRLALIGGVSCTLLGYGLPKLNQKLTQFFVDREKSEKQPNRFQSAQAPAGPTSAMQPPSPFATSSFKASNFPVTSQVQPFTAFAAAPRSAFASVVPNPFVPVIPYGTAPKAPQFGAGFNVADIVQTLQKNNQWATAITSDAPLASGRVITARNNDERIEKAIKEAVLISTIYFIQPWIEDKLSGEMQHIGFPALKKMYQHYTIANPQANFINDYESLLKSHFNDSKTIASAFPATPKQEEAFLEKIREFYNKRPIDMTQGAVQKMENLLFELSEASGKIPTIDLKEAGKVVGKHIDITQKIDLDGMKAMGTFLDEIAVKARNAAHSDVMTAVRDKAVSVTGKKALAFAGSAAFCWMLMSYAEPKARLAFTAWHTGIKNYFPGLTTNTQHRAIPVGFTLPVV